jgi:hypothetical protein
MTTRYPTPQYRRTALVPAILAAIVLLATVPLVGSDPYLIVRFAVSILALIVVVFAWQAKQWWWLLGLVPIAVLFNPVLPIEQTVSFQQGAHYVSVLVFLAAGVFIRVTNPDDRNAR